MGTTRSKLVVYATIYAKNGSRSISHAAKTENPVPRSFFAPEPNENACYAGESYALTGKLLLAFW